MRLPRLRRARSPVDPAAALRAAEEARAQIGVSQARAERIRWKVADPLLDVGERNQFAWLLRSSLMDTPAKEGR